MAVTGGTNFGAVEAEADRQLIAKFIVKPCPTVHDGARGLPDWFFLGHNHAIVSSLTTVSKLTNT